MKHVILYSDTWSGQSRNQFVEALHHAVLTMDKIEIIDQKFLESGHSQMDFDAMHSTIERATTTTTTKRQRFSSQASETLSSRQLELLYHMLSYHLAMKTAWTFKNVAASRFCNTKTDMKGDRVNWLNFKWLHCLEEDKETLLFQQRMVEGFKQLKIEGSNR